MHGITNRLRTLISLAFVLVVAGVAAGTAYGDAVDRYLANHLGGGIRLVTDTSYGAAVGHSTGAAVNRIDANDRAHFPVRSTVTSRGYPDGVGRYLANRLGAGITAVTGASSGAAAPNSTGATLNRIDANDRAHFPVSSPTTFVTDTSDRSGGGFGMSLAGAITTTQDGFDWSDALVGAFGALAAMLVGTTATLFVLRRRRAGQPIGGLSA